ncbi:PR domain zinc finger protein 10, partial [Hyalella azteca]|uniref:PR domain zinc finger protein 10 n=1 Tax=Hyalella azteca TaxID=294128 RepID=A0A8B7N0R9_HYAAZ
MLVNHLLKCHPKVPLCSVQELNQPLPNTKLNYKCPYCQKYYRSNVRRNQHISKTHPGKDTVKPNAAVELAPPDVSDSSADGCVANEASYRYAAKCTLCQREYLTNAKLYQHFRRHHPDVCLPSRVPEIAALDPGHRVGLTASEELGSANRNAVNLPTNKASVKKARASNGSSIAYDSTPMLALAKGSNTGTSTTDFSDG